MKRTLYLLLAALFAAFCNQENALGANNAKSQSQTYTAGEAKRDDKTVEDMFLLLPDEAFGGNYPLPLRQKMVKQPQQLQLYKKGNREYCGTASVYPERGLIEFTCEASFAEYRVYYHSVAGRGLITVIDVNKLSAYWYKGGKLVKDDSFYAFVNEAYSNSTEHDFFDLSNLPKEVAKEAENLTKDTAFYDKTVEVSEKGVVSVTIMYDNPYEYKNWETLEPLKYYLKFERIDSKWTKSRIKERD